MNFLIWIIGGIALGAITYYVSSAKVKGGILSFIGAGVAGALLGAFIANIILNRSVFSVTYSSVFGALIMMFLLSMGEIFFLKEDGTSQDPNPQTQNQTAQRNNNGRQMQNPQTARTA